MLRNMPDKDPDVVLAIKVLDATLRDARALSLAYCCKKENRASLKHEQHRFWCRSRVFQPGVTTTDEELEETRADLKSLVDHPDFGGWILRAGGLPESIEGRRQILRDLLAKGEHAEEA